MVRCKINTWFLGNRSYYIGGGVEFDTVCMYITKRYIIPRREITF